ncbi:hypothetical protein [Paractinoplanes durhamensis]|uniref:hypothetical protein n=1 Tax=Paractinoplanes durhamensis TaxID=113563 RepID=UPI00362E1FEF
MIWLTWRQFRTQAAVGLALVIAVAAVYLSTRSTLLDIARDTGYAACTADCGKLAQQFVQTARTGYLGQLYQAGALLLILLPALIGLFWGRRWSPASWRAAPTGWSGTSRSAATAGSA